MRRFVSSLVVVGLVGVIGCTGTIGPGGDDTHGDDLPATVVFLTPTQHLSRASLALRGVRPSIEDLKAVEADPDALGGIVDRYLDSPEFGATIKDLHNDTLLMRMEYQPLQLPLTATFTNHTVVEINGSAYEEPLRLIEDIVMHDQPYTQIVTADYTLVDGIIAQIWGFPHSGPANVFTRYHWTDGRPSAGVLSTEVLYHRWISAGANYSRGRANLISRAFLCHDFLHSDIVVDTSIDLSDPEVVSNAVVANPSCAGCHQTLDPLASYLMTFANHQPIAQLAQGQRDYPIGGYDPLGENRYRGTNHRPPMFFGVPATKLDGLGKAIADDPRFARCTAARFASYLTEVPLDDVSGAWVARLQKLFVENNFSAKKLARAVVLSDEFRVSHDTNPETADRLIGTQKLRPEQLSRMIRDLTGFRWTTPSGASIRSVPYGTGDLLDGDLVGFRVLFGGIDSYFVTERVHTMNATSSLVAKAAASAAAEYIVEHDAVAAAADRKLFTAAAVGTTDETAVRAQIAYLHARIFGDLVAADSADVDQTYQLFTAAAAASTPKRAWKIVLIAMLTDFRSLFY